MNSIVKETRKWSIDIKADKTKAMMVTGIDHKEIDIKYTKENTSSKSRSFVIWK